MAALSGLDLVTLREIGRAKERADPLAYWKCRSWVQRALLSCWLLFKELVEVYWHAGNSGGKTSGGAVLALALLQRREEVDGIRLPTMPAQVYGALLVHSYKQATLSSIKALRELLGDWPHHEAPASDDCPGVIYIKQHGCQSDDRSKWSRLLVFPRDGEIPDGLRLHLAWADEPPDEKMWRELRFRGISGLRYFRFITATPKLKKFWGWLLGDYEKSVGKEPGTEQDWQQGVKNDRLRLESSIYDNKALTPGDLRRAEKDAENDPEKEARLWGKHVDATGKNPWSYAVLARWRARCEDPKTERLVIQAEKDNGAGKMLTEIACELQVWDAPDFLDSYYIPLDPAKGIDKDPDGLHVWSIRKNRLVARLNASIGGFGLGMAAAILARRYNNALVDPAVTGGYGETVLTGLRVSEYWNVNRQEFFDRETKEWASRLGYNEDQAFAARIRGAIDRAILTDSCEIPSADVISCMMHCQFDENGKIVGEYKYPDEDLVLAGAAQVFIGNRSQRPEVAEEPKLDFDEAWARENGRLTDPLEPDPVVIERW